MKLDAKGRKAVQSIVKACYPEYTGRKVSIQPANRAPRELRSYWDEGSRSYYCFYNLDTREVLQVHSNHPFFEANQPSQLRELPAHIVLVSHSIFCGKDCGITLYGHLAPLLPVGT